MAHDVDHVAVRIAEEEAPHAPLLVLQRVDDLGAARAHPLVRGIDVVDTTRDLARRIGNLLARAGKGSENHVDATVVATAIAAGGGVILTSDVDDLTALAAGAIGVAVEPV